MIRIAKPEETSELIDIIRRSFSEVSIDKTIEDNFGQIISRPWYERKAMDIKRDVTMNPEGIFVKVVDGKIAGFITTALDRDFSTGRIPHLAILPAYQGKSIGKELINHALKYIKASGMKLMRIEVLAHNGKAKKMYEGLGFKEMSVQLHLAMPSESYNTDVGGH